MGRRVIPARALCMFSNSQSVNIDSLLQCDGRPNRLEGSNPPRQASLESLFQTDHPIDYSDEICVKKPNGTLLSLFQVGISLHTINTKNTVFRKNFLDSFPRRPLF